MSIRLIQGEQIRADSVCVTVAVCARGQNAK